MMIAHFLVANWQSSLSVRVPQLYCQEHRKNSTIIIHTHVRRGLCSLTFIVNCNIYISRILRCVRLAFQLTLSADNRLSTLICWHTDSPESKTNRKFHHITWVKLGNQSLIPFNLVELVYFVTQIVYSKLDRGHIQENVLACVKHLRHGASS